jgi:hypothetical protein
MPPHAHCIKDAIWFFLAPGFTMEAAMYTRPDDPVEFQLGLSIMLGFFFFFFFLNLNFVSI